MRNQDSRHTCALRIGKAVIVAANIAFLVAIGVWTYKNIALADFLKSLGTIPRATMLTVMLLKLAVLGVYGWRLAVLLNERLRPSIAVSILASGFNALLPLRLGDVAKLAYAYRLYRISPFKLGTATVVEKMADLAALAGMAAFVIYTKGIIGLSIKLETLIAILAIGLVMLSTVVLLSYRFLRTKESPSSYLLSIAESVLYQTRPRVLIAALVITVLIWAITIGMMEIGFQANFPQFGIVDAMALTVVLALAIALPTAPAGLGVVEASMVGYLTLLLDADPTSALAVAVTFRITTITPELLITLAIVGRSVLADDGQASLYRQTK